MSDAILRYYGYEKLARNLTFMYTVTLNGAAGFVVGGVREAILEWPKYLFGILCWIGYWIFLLDMLTV